MTHATVMFGIMRDLIQAKTINKINNQFLAL